MFIAFFKFLRGYVKIRIEGYSPERFLNLCSNHDMLLWNIENHCDYYIMCISLQSFFQLKPFLKKTKTKVAVLERYGLPFFIPKLIKRKIFLLGLLGCLLAMLFLSNYVWAISFIGNYSITSDVLLDYLAKQQISYGTKKTELEIEQLEENIRRDFNNITWTSVRINGTKLEIRIKENENTKVDQEIAQKKEEAVQQLNQYKSSDLVADKEGKVVRMITRNGVPQVRAESEVKPGDILIKGQIPILGEDGLVKKYQYCNADADIYLQCQYPYQDEVFLRYLKKVFTGREKKIFCMELAGNQFALNFQKTPYPKFDKITDKKQVRLVDNFYLPVFYGKTILKEYRIEEIQRLPKEGRQLIEERFYKFMQTLTEKGVQIIEKNVKIEKVGGKVTAKGSLTVIERAGKTVVREMTGEQSEMTGEQSE